jgi:hypothetical protein
MRTAQPLMERLNDWQSHNHFNTNTSNPTTRGQQVDNTAPLQLASHYTRTLIIRSIYRPFCTLNSRSSSQTATNGSGSSMESSEIEAYTHYRLAAKSAANRFTDFAREISDRQIRAFWPFCKLPSSLPTLPTAYRGYLFPCIANDKNRVYSRLGDHVQPLAPFTRDCHLRHRARRV